MRKKKGKNRKEKAVWFAVFVTLGLCGSAMNSYSQSGGAFTVEKSVIAAGGGTIAGGAFTVESTIGQTTAGNSAGGAFNLFGGFITPPNLTPTAASVAVGGRVRNESGKGIKNVRVTLTDGSGESRTILTGTGGTFRFVDVTIGETYIVTVSAKRFTFANPTQVLSLFEETNELEFIGYTNGQ